MSFLKAEWRKLAIVNYQVDENLLKPYLPVGTELDTWNGIHYISLVGFMFINTKVLGMKIPFHVNFEEVNLRFYVKEKTEDGWKRGVVFIREIVPKHAITFVANTLYGEHYVTHKMKHLWQEDKATRKVVYGWKINNKWQYLEVIAEKEARKMEANSEVEFITEHYWGYTKINENKTTAYEVRHPRWDYYKVKDYTIALDYKLTYGDQFRFLNFEAPKSVMLAEGSSISVEEKRVISK